MYDSIIVTLILLVDLTSCVLLWKSTQERTRQRIKRTVSHFLKQIQGVN